ncbi:hypothetical protein m02_10440 [Bartonella bovis m02]|uniref:Right handed beta helix domain-containing protein n=2 Tax=Bartonella bovis TaxID=155194 RepID=N6VCV4_9HYPH|nr:hypothetical protein m02_10440 [Bartonella bovis m02]
MVMGCVFKHHVYLCVVSTAMLAGLSLITSHTKVYAKQQNCGTVSSDGSGVVNKPIVCDRSSGTMVLNTSSGRGNEIEINMSKHSNAETAVTITGSGTNIIATKKLKVTGMVKGGSGKGPVIKVLSGGKLMLHGGVEVEVTGAGMKKVIEVNSGGTLMMDGESTIKVKGDGTGLVGVQMGSMEKLMMMRNVIFENVSEGINIKGGGSGGSVMVMGLGKTTMTVKNSGSVGIKVEDTGKINATVMGLKIERSGTGSGSKGVEFVGNVTGKGTGTLTLNMVEISGFETGVSASKGTLNIMGNSAITVTSGGMGLEVKGEAMATMTGGRIVGSGDGMGVKMGSSKTLMLNSVDISNVGVGGKYGVQVTGEGTVTMMGGSIMEFETGVSASNGTLVMMGGTKITVKGGTGLEVKETASAILMGGTEIKVTSGGTGLSVSGEAMATLTGAVIKGTDGKGMG